MPLHGILSLTERRVLEAKHECLQRQALAIRKEMNTGNTAAVLPEHILVTIFQLYAAAPCLPDIHGWLAISWVCSRWRTIALLAAVLWTQIPVTELAVVGSYLSRSKTLPLYITGKLCNVPKEKVGNKIQRDQSLRSITTWSSVLTHAARIEGLTIDHDFRLKQGRLCASGLRYAKFPKLRCLSIQGRNIDELHPVKDCEQLPALLRGLDQMQQLEEVATKCIPLPLVTNLFSPSLKKLDIGILAYATPAAAWTLPWDTFWSKLGQLSSLQQLSLATFPPLPASGTAHLPPTPLTLPALTKLTLSWRDTDRALEAAHFLAHTALPARCALHVAQTGGTGTVRAFEALCAAVARARAAPAAPLRTLRIARVTEHAVQLACWTAALSVAALVVRPGAPRAPEPAPLLKVAVHSSCSAAQLGGLLRMLPLQSVTNVALCDASGGFLSPGMPAHGVRALLVSEQAAHEAIRGLGGGGCVPVPMPALEALHLVDLYVGEDGRGWAGELRTSLQRRSKQLPDAPRLRLVVDDPKLHDTRKWMYIVEPVVESVGYVMRL
ncbi:hypothetical protein PsYK624_034190 [Phanerochaete sordida]|uniref:F-box domain-containing protein n=1 Tax=Phanerochaete sordida TaxID=48140 RepID=A0A9P3G304_9APHY|nr:hypothetical protein PsYK624_034190 [Phanerochaete sordida]